MRAEAEIDRWKASGMPMTRMTSRAAGHFVILNHDGR